MTKEERKLLKSLRAHLLHVQSFISAMDKVMKLPSDERRGKLIAGYINALDMQNQIAMHFDAGMSFKQIEKIRGMNP